VNAITLKSLSANRVNVALSKLANVMVHRTAKKLKLANKKVIKFKQGDIHARKSGSGS
jgi:hypothetical protein